MTATLRGASVAQARRALAERLRIAGIESPELDARVLIGHALGLDHTGLVAAAPQQLSDLTASQVERFAARRLAGEPVARIVGVREFWGLPLQVTPDVLVPRPETETIVELALDLVGRTGSRTRPLRIADLGTGSGAILLALLSELPNAYAVGTDIDVRALDVARANAGPLDLGARAAFVVSDFGTALAGPFDLVVSNPPYIASAQIATLAPEVREHDPRRALDGGADGLAAYRIIASDAPRLLAPTGHLVVEIGAGQAAAVAAELEAKGLAIAATRPDLSFIVRALAATALSAR
ncbi:MAG: release factor glutamine methyltransferase [Hyphomicrobiales bacterium]|nr:release factor glutamine methyltransferase [Hyphomicrobiales bacterium]